MASIRIRLLSGDQLLHKYSFKEKNDHDVIFQFSTLQISSQETYNKGVSFPHIKNKVRQTIEHNFIMELNSNQWDDLQMRSLIVAI